MRVLPCGRDAVLIELADADERRRWAAAVLAAELPVTDLVIGARTVLLVGKPAALREAAAGIIPDEPTRTQDAPRARAGDLAMGADQEPENITDHVTEIEVSYDGLDLAEVADLLGIDVGEVVERHTGQVWTVDFTGFLPGFGYLLGDGSLEVPRRSTPRESVPAGAVGLAGAFTGVYPAASPGGWQLIGTALTPVWLPDRDPPALLSAGARIRFVASSGEPPDPPAPSRPEGTALTVVDPGPLALVEDLGRPGQLAVGLARSGAFDRAALSLGNRLLGNPEGAAGLEILLRATLRAEQDLWLCVTGAPGPNTVDGVDVAAQDPFFVAAGVELRLSPGPRGLRRYVTVRGGLDTPLVLGSRAAHPSAGLGVAALHAGDGLPVASTADTDWAVPDVRRPRPPDTVTSATWGPRADWFTDEARQTFARTTWAVTAASDRTGVRLAGPPLTRSEAGELPSEGLVPGAVQVPADGQPLVFGPDHPATGGYPVIAVLDDLDAVAQWRPGDRITFDL